MSIEGKAVSFFISSLNGGGADRVCTTLANALSNKGWEVTIIIIQPYRVLLQQIRTL